MPKEPVSGNGRSGSRSAKELTEAGRAAAQAGVIAAEAVERQMLAGLTNDEAKLLRELLRRCADTLDPDN